MSELRVVFQMLPSGLWGLRATQALRPGTMVDVAKKNGATTRVTVGPAVTDPQGGYVYEVQVAAPTAPLPARRRERGSRAPIERGVSYGELRPPAHGRTLVRWPMSWAPTSDCVGRRFRAPDGAWVRLVGVRAEWLGRKESPDGTAGWRWHEHVEPAETPADAPTP